MLVDPGYRKYKPSCWAEGPESGWKSYFVCWQSHRNALLSWTKSTQESNILSG